MALDVEHIVHGSGEKCGMSLTAHKNNPAEAGLNLLKHPRFINRERNHGILILRIVPPLRWKFPRPDTTPVPHRQARRSVSRWWWAPMCRRTPFPAEHSARTGFRLSQP